MAQAESGSTSAIAGIGTGVAAAAAAAVFFVLITANTGTTYHLFPLLMAFLPAGLPRVMFERRIGAREATIAAVLGAAVVGAAWLMLVLVEEMPAATLISDQPGGVGGEFVLFGMLGAAVGSWWGSRAA